MNGKNILLINVKSRTASTIQKQVPLGLLKLSTFYKKQNCNVEYIIAGDQPKNKPDIICFSTIFLFNVDREIGFIKAYQKKFPNAKIRVGGISASLRPDLFKSKIKNIDLHVGLFEEIENEKPDYEIANVGFSYGFTHRGCINKCPWCVVPKIEGDMKLNPHWKNYLGKNHKLFSAMDNNIMACSPERLDEILKEVYTRNMKIEFNQAMDCVLFAKNENYVKVFSKYPKIFHRIRFAWDNKRQDKYVLKSLELLDKYNIKGLDRNIWLALYAYKEQPEIIFERWKKLLSYGQCIKPMRYRDVQTGAYGDFWNGFCRDLANAISTISPTGLLNTEQNFLFKEDNFEDFKINVKAINIFRSKFKGIILQKESFHIFEKIVKALKNQLN